MPSAEVVDSGLRLGLGQVTAPRSFVRLYRADLDVLPGSRLVDFPACLFPGYADIEITGLWTGAIIDAVGRALSAVYNLSWTRSAGGVPETVYGWLWYYGPDPTGQLIAGRKLTVPQAINTAGQSLTLSVLAYLLRG